MNIYSLAQIKKIISQLDLSLMIETGFKDYSAEKVVVPPIGELIFEHPPGDAHIKYGYIKGGSDYVIKIASGFHQNLSLGLPTSDGLMLVLSQKTGRLKSILLDEGFLTNVRTAVAGQIVAKYYAPKNISAIGVLGTGLQAKMQVEYLKPVTSCNKVIAWGRSSSNQLNYKKYMEEKGYQVTLVNTPKEVAQRCNLIITTTSSSTALLKAEDIETGTHITAMGSDTANKQELDESILIKADLIIVDSKLQSLERGEVHKALISGVIVANSIHELGTAINSSPQFVRQTERQITIADLTGVAVQDIVIATAVCDALKLESKSL